MLAWATGVSHLPTADVSEGDNSAPDVVVKTELGESVEHIGLRSVASVVCDGQLQELKLAVGF